MADNLIDDKTKGYFQSLGRYLAYVVLSVVVLTMVSLSSALVGKWAGITPAVPTFPPPPIPTKAQDLDPLVVPVPVPLEAA